MEMITKYKKSFLIFYYSVSREACRLIYLTKHSKSDKMTYRATTQATIV